MKAGIHKIVHCPSANAFDCQLRSPLAFLIFVHTVRKRDLLDGCAQRSATSKHPCSLILRAFCCGRLALSPGQSSFGVRQAAPVSPLAPCASCHCTKIIKPGGAEKVSASPRGVSSNLPSTRIRLCRDQCSHTPPEGVFRGQKFENTKEPSWQQQRSQ